VGIEGGGRMKNCKCKISRVLRCHEELLGTYSI
jgi:hypothetical protein